MATNGPNEDAQAAIMARLVALRPALHRYAARMVGSSLDGEDVVQEAIASAVAALDRVPPEGDAEPWLFRITHNAAVDFLRRRKRFTAEREVMDDDLVSDDDEASRTLATRVAMAVFMRLPPSQRGTVILKDVLGYSNEEVASILGSTVAAGKAALHRGRARLREYAHETPAAPWFEADEMARLQNYVDRFNARDFDAIRSMLADDVRFDLVARQQGGKASFENYFTRYGEMTAWKLSVGWLDGRLAAIVTDRADPSAVPANAIVVDWRGGRIVRLRDFHHAPYALEGAAMAILPRP
jgi:RNA polymerase sigma-70 factor (ECF subfamily)